MSSLVDQLLCICHTTNIIMNCHIIYRSIISPHGHTRSMINTLGMNPERGVDTNGGVGVVDTIATKPHGIGGTTCSKVVDLPWP